MPVVNEGAGRSSHQGQHRLSRRKYQELTRFLKEVITNQKAGLKVRMAAASRLDDIYRRHEEAQVKLAERKAKVRSEVGKPTEEQEPATEPAPESTSDAVRKFLNTFGGKTSE